MRAAGWAPVELLISQWDGIHENPHPPYGHPLPSEWARDSAARPVVYPRHLSVRRRRKGDANKAQMAGRLRAKPTMTWPWIARRLEMGQWRTAANAERKAVSKKD